MTSAREASMRVVVDFDKCKSNALCPTQAISLAD
jgi:ferredoxin